MLFKSQKAEANLSWAMKKMESIWLKEKGIPKSFKIFWTLFYVTEQYNALG